MSGEWTDYLIKLASILGAISAISLFVFKSFQLLIVNPQNKFAAKIQAESNRQLSVSLNPLTQAIDKLNSLLDESQRDREELHQRIDCIIEDIESNSRNIFNNDKRLIVLEVRSGIKKR